MDSSIVKYLSIFGVVSSSAALVDTLPFITVLLTILTALVAATLAAKYAVKEASKEIDRAFLAKSRQLHREHKAYVESVVDDRIKG